jgi:transcriptional regulator with XRE-family HTH domain
MHETLRLWGKNIAAFRLTRKPDGSLRATAEDDPMGQADLGRLMDPPVSQATVSRWEAGLMEPRRQYKAQLARVLGVDVTTLFPLTKAVA